MRITTAPLAFAATLLVFGCTNTQHAPQKLQASAADAQSFTHTYRCESGETIAANYPTTDSATIQYKGHSHPMNIAISASGARYVGDGLEWWTKGSDGTLSTLNADSTSGESIERCKAR
ncbi:Hypothetical protein HDN1F_25930 [gamma proteobacterium HdN1]|nr:Hypothetical protein HDN1F_25930 [gamma proteobacterium HdN1]